MVLRVEALRERLAKLEEVVTRLREIAGVSAETFARDYRQAGNHILAGEFGESAPEYEDIVRRLGQRGVLSPSLAQRLRGLGGFRNILVHGYLRLDPQKVYEALQRSAGDFTDFEAEILAWLGSR